MENRDRKYDTDVYRMRGHYQVADQDFDLSQFGLFLATGTLFMTFHLNDMLDGVGRKIMAGDVLELEHLTDYDPLNQDIPAALKRFFVVGDCSFASEGFSPTWWPHLWRVKINPLVDGQEYKDILDQIVAGTANTTSGSIDYAQGPISATFARYDDGISSSSNIIGVKYNLASTGTTVFGLYSSDVASNVSTTGKSIGVSQAITSQLSVLANYGETDTGKTGRGVGVAYAMNKALNFNARWSFIDTTTDVTQYGAGVEYNF
jgi:hypothetical protein